MTTSFVAKFSAPGESPDDLRIQACNYGTIIIARVLTLIIIY